MIISFDVETRGLFGEAFAFGAVLATDKGETVYTEIHCCGYEDAEHGPIADKSADDEWLEANVLPNLPPPDSFTTRRVRDHFLDFCIHAKREAEKRGESLYFLSDVAFPCDVRFLLQCQADGQNLQIYPLFDVSSVLLAKGYNPVGTFARRDNELPAHNPLNDARQSLRVYFAALNGQPIE